MKQRQEADTKVLLVDVESKESTRKNSIEMIETSEVTMIEKLTGITETIKIIKGMTEKMKDKTEKMTEKMIEEMKEGMTEGRLATTETYAIIEILLIISKKKEEIEDQEEEIDTMIKMTD